ncbi:DUF72 domain-containing protein [Streptacidiphilus carbonis]|uniref:DUF72 domain-containing protein n=1 Tax=Streptacidiphilus carbonis TaxID=105422 RepID=UPI0005A9AAA6|nr:DUF72 domain-containing protein [Streptacidiphilus carbonis]
MGIILVGTAGWADRELTASGWYPPGTRTPAQRLAHYASRFGLVEADSPYYAIPTPAVVQRWADSTPDGFVMDVKAFSALTGHPGRVHPRDPELAWQRFHEALAPLRTAGRMGRVLLQFPPWCTAGPHWEQRVGEALDRCRPLPAAVEFRHPSWFADPQRRGRTLEYLRSRDAAHVCVDMPKGHPGAVPPLLAATSSTAVVRLHGHSEDWIGGSKEDRFRYTYSDRELALWADRLSELAAQADEVHAVLNTCCAGEAQRAAEALRRLLPAHGSASAG